MFLWARFSDCFKWPPRSFAFIEYSWWWSTGGGWRTRTSTTVTCATKTLTSSRTTGNDTGGDAPGGTPTNWPECRRTRWPGARCATPNWGWCRSRATSSSAPDSRAKGSTTATSSTTAQTGSSLSYPTWQRPDSTPRLIRNCRYNCFKCDYDACDRCIEEIQGNVLAFGTTYNPRDEVDAREREFYHRRRKDRDEAREKAKGHWAVAVKKKTIGKLSLAKAVNQLKLQQQLEQQPQQQQQQQTRHENPWTVAAAANCSNSFRPNHVTTTSSPSLSQQPPPPPPPPPQRPPSQPLTSFRDRIKRIRLRKADGEDDNAVRLPDKASTTLVATEPLAILMNEAGPWMRRPSSSPIMKTPAERDRESQQGHFRHTHQHQHQHHNQPQPQPQPQQQQQQQHPRQLYQHQRRVRMREEEDDEEEEEDEDGDEQSQQQQQQYHSHFRPTVVAVMPRDIFNSHQHQQQTSCRRKPASAAVVSESVEVIIEPRRRQDEDEDGSSEDDLDGHEEDPYYQEDRRALRAANPNVWFESELWYP